MKKLLPLIICLLTTLHAYTQQTANKPEREQWFMDLGFGMFIHWSMDAQLGAVISHSMAGASQDYLRRFVNELPRTFNPKHFDPDEWAVLAKLAGMKYVVFTAKHHSGFCMFRTKTTDFNIMQTPFARDATKEIIEAFRRQSIAIGLYFSPEDFYFLYKHHLPIGRMQHPKHYPANNPELMAYDKQQLKELLTQYGKIDILFFDGPAEGLKEYCWQLQPDLMVTRGQIKTPEQTLPGKPLPGPWEACFTMGTDWQYKPTNDTYKSGTDIINMLIEIRAKGGNFLLNIGPKPDGSLREEENGLLCEVGLWNFANGEGIHNIRPWELIREGNIWFTRGKDNNTVYAFVTRTDWKYGERKELVIRTLRGNANTKVEVLGYDSQLVEYREGYDAGIYVQPTPIGLVISAVNGQRFYTNNQWPNPVVLKITNVSYQPLETGKEKRDTTEGAL